MERIMTEYGVFTSNEVTGQSAEEVFQAHIASHNYVDGEWIPKQIDTPSKEIKTNQELTEELELAQQTMADLEIELILLK